MKYGEHLRMSLAPEYGPEPYLNYEKLDGIIRQLSEKAPARYERKTHVSNVFIKGWLGPLQLPVSHCLSLLLFTLFFSFNHDLTL